MLRLEHFSFISGDLILVLIAIISIIATFFFFERLVVLHRARTGFADFLTGVFNILSKGKIREALAICEETPGPVSSITHSAIMHIGEPPESIRSAISNTGNIEVARMERHLRIIAVIIHLSPLLGLLGSFISAIGLIQSLQSAQPLVQSIDLADLSSALQCAAAGIASSILTFAMSSIISSRIDRVILDMEQAASDIMAFLPSLHISPSTLTAKSSK